MKDYNKWTKKVESLVTQRDDANIVMSLGVLNTDPRAMWDQPARDYDTVTPAQRMAERKAFVDLTILEESTHLEKKAKLFTYRIRSLLLITHAVLKASPCYLNLVDNNNKSLHRSPQHD